MSVLTDPELEIAALRLRIADALVKLNQAGQLINHICEGAGVPLDETLRASVALGEVRNTLWNGPLPPNVVRFRRRSIFASADEARDDREPELTTAQEIGAGSYNGNGNNLP